MTQKAHPAKIRHTRWRWPLSISGSARLTPLRHLAISLSDTEYQCQDLGDSGQNKLYDEQLAERFGSALSPSNNGGSNYAAGGDGDPGIKPCG